MATSDSTTIIVDISDLFSDEIEGEVVKQEGTFGFNVKKPETDLILLIEDKKIYVTRVILETISPSFKKIISEQLLNGEENEVRIHDKTFEDFVEFLACIYPGKMHEVTSTNVHRVLPLASEYDVDFLKRRAESVLIDEMSKAGVDESFFVQCGNTAIHYNLLSLRQKSLANVARGRLEEISTLDKELPLEDKGRLMVYEEMLPSLRSEACRNRYMSAGHNCKSLPTMNLEPFTDAKYERLDFQLDTTIIKPVSFVLVIWDRRHKLTVKEVRYLDSAGFIRADGTYSNAINLTLTIVYDKSCSRFQVAFKVLVKNYDPHCSEGDFCRQECKEVKGLSSDSLCVSLPMKGLKDMKYRINGMFTFSVHILMNNPKSS